MTSTEPAAATEGQRDTIPQQEIADDARYLNRELSEVAFNARVLELAADRTLPVLERLKFAAITSNNLDEFFAKRVDGLRKQAQSGVDVRSIDGLTPSQQLAAIKDHVDALLARQTELFADELVPALAEAGIELCDWDDLDKDDQATLTERFERSVHPLLTPLAVDRGRPFPHISSLSLSLVALLAEPESDQRRLARIKVPEQLDRFQRVGDRFVPVEQLLAAHLDRLFPGMRVLEHACFRVTRNADIDLDEDHAEDLLGSVDEMLLERRFGQAVRLELDPELPEDIREWLMSELELDENAVYELAPPLDLSGLFQLAGLDAEEHQLEPVPPVVPPRFRAVDDVFAELRRADVLVHHPYESFDHSVQRFIQDAAKDPATVALKVAIYRTSESESPIVESLIAAAEGGKQVVALVELKARFDEEANIARARRLEEAGVHVVYGLVGLKTHTKTALVVREEEGELRAYTHVGTGNYNPVTAKRYEDLGVLSADPTIGRDVIELFNALTGYVRRDQYERLLVAPINLRDAILDRIRGEAVHDDGHIVMKLNNLSDPAIIDELYAASAQGCRVDLIVRTVCCLRPGVADLSETIAVRSVVGRYLEHSRIFRFGSEARTHEFLIGSADMMPRNLDDRMEAVRPVDDPVCRERLAQVVDLLLDEDAAVWALDADATWHRRAGTFDVQERLFEAAAARP